MLCPNCQREIGIVKTCPHCAHAISYGGNTVLFQKAVDTKLSWRDIFSDVFKKHRSGDVERALRSDFGTEADMLSQWMKPWMFLRAFLGMLVVLVLLGVLEYLGFGLAAVPTIMFIGCALMPFTMLLLFWEMDIPRRVRFTEVLALLFIGGIFSLIIGGLLNIVVPGDSAMWAGVTEEPAKLLIAVLFMVIWKRKFYILDGLLIGAAVAAGFGFIESIGYVAMQQTTVLNMNAGMWAVLINRSLHALVGHIMYTSIFVGALCWVMNGKPFRPKHLLDIRFIAFFAIGIVMHMLHNSDMNDVLIAFEYFAIYYMDLVKFPVLWLSLLFIVNRGIKQVLRVSTGQTVVMFDGLQGAPEYTRAALLCREGPMAGSCIPLEDGKTLTIGRDPSACNLIIDGSARGVSRVHCSVRRDGSLVILRDLGASFGTLLTDGQRLAAQTDVALTPGQTFRLGNSDYVFEVQM